MSEDVLIIGSAFDFTGFVCCRYPKPLPSIFYFAMCSFDYINDAELDRRFEAQCIRSINTVWAVDFFSPPLSCHAILSRFSDFFPAVVFFP